MRRVAVTGLGMVSPVGHSSKQSWEQALAAKSGVRPIELFDSSPLPVHIAAEVKGFDPATILEPKEVKRTSRFVQFALAAAKEAIADAGLELQAADTRRMGCSIGVGMGALANIEENAIILKEKGPRRISPFFIPYAIPNMAAGIVSLRHNLKGPNLSPATACTSGTHGIGEAYLYIKNNLADVMVCGGAESTICGLGISAFAAMKALSTRNHEPEEASSPFDRRRDGFVMGEGAGLMVLEDWDHAVKRGATIYGELAGYGMSGDAHHITSPADEGEGAQRSMQAALDDAGIAPDKVDYINAHGTSTPLNDKFESQAIAKVFGDHAQKLAVSSTKGVTGHCIGAAGGIEAVFSVMALHHGVMPPTANLKEADPDCPLDYIPHVAREAKLGYVLSNSFGFGGTNATLVFKSAAS